MENELAKDCKKADCLQENPQPLSSFETTKRRGKLSLRGACRSCRRLEASNRYHRLCGEIDSFQGINYV